MSILDALPGQTPQQPTQPQGQPSQPQGLQGIQQQQMGQETPLAPPPQKPISDGLQALMVLQKTAAQTTPDGKPTIAAQIGQQAQQAMAPQQPQPQQPQVDPRLLAMTMAQRMPVGVERLLAQKQAMAQPQGQGVAGLPAGGMARPFKEGGIIGFEDGGTAPSVTIASGYPGSADEEEPIMGFNRTSIRALANLFGLAGPDKMPITAETKHNMYARPDLDTSKETPYLPPLPDYNPPIPDIQIQGETPKKGTPPAAGSVRVSTSVSGPAGKPVGAEQQGKDALTVYNMLAEKPDMTGANKAQEELRAAQKGRPDFWQMNIDALKQYETERQQAYNEQKAQRPMEGLMAHFRAGYGKAGGMDYDDRMRVVDEQDRRSRLLSKQAVIADMKARQAAQEGDLEGAAKFEQMKLNVMTEYAKVNGPIKGHILQEQAQRYVADQHRIGQQILANANADMKVLQAYEAAYKIAMADENFKDVARQASVPGNVEAQQIMHKRMSDILNGILPGHNLGNEYLRYVGAGTTGSKYGARPAGAVEPFK